ncbi:MAG: ABC transporter permease [Candidatus Acidiferrum sp.]
MGSFRLDLRYAFRLVLKNPAFTATVVLILALGIGANAAIYSIVDTVIMQSLPGRNPGEIVSLYSTEQKGGADTGMFSYPEFRAYRESLTSFSGVAAYHLAGLQVAQGEGIAHDVTGAIVSGDFFEILGVDPKYGRLFSASDDGARGSNPVAVLSERYWKQQFDGRPDVIGSSLRINDRLFTVIGVAPASVQQIEPASQIWLPMSMAIEAEPMMATQIDRLSNDFFHVIARLKPGVSLPMAQAELDTVSARLGSGQTIRLWEGMEGEQASPSKSPPDSSGKWEEYDWKKPWARLAPARTGFAPEQSRLSWLLLSIAALVLLVATLDVAGLLLARSENEEKEYAIRASLGASRWILLRQRLVQGSLLAILGAIAGLFTAFCAAKLLFASAPEGFLLPVGVASSVLNARVIAFVLGVSTLTAVGFSLLTAFRVRREDLGESLKRQSAGLGAGSRCGPRLQAVLVISQIAASVVLLVGAALLLQTMRNVAHIDLGFDTDHVLSASLDLSRDGYTKEHGAAMLPPILEKVRAIPGAKSVALVGGPPVLWRPKSVKPSAPDCRNIGMSMISPDYFKTLSIPLFRGRDFTTADSKNAPGVVILNQAAAKLCWADGDPIGKSYGGLLTVPKPFQIVGLVGNVRTAEADEDPRPRMYTPLAQFYDALPWQFSFSVLVRTDLPPHQIVPALVSQIRSLDPNLVLYDIRTPREMLSGNFASERFFTRILSVFGVLALVLAVAGLYGLLAFVTAKRTREFGVRMALGALPQQILRLVLSQGGRLIALGLLIGLFAAAGAARFLQSLLFGVSAIDAPIFLLASLPLLLTGLAACFLPAKRAATVDPMIALRDE